MDVSPAGSADRSEGELSESEIGDDLGHQPAVDSNSAAHGPSPRQPGNYNSSTICALLQDLLGQGSEGIGGSPQGVKGWKQSLRIYGLG